MMQPHGVPGLVLAGLAIGLGMAAGAEARQGVAPRPAVEVGIRSVTPEQERTGAGVGAQVTWNLDNRRAIEVSADFRPNAGTSTLRMREAYVFLKHTFHASGAGGFFGMVGGVAVMPGGVVSVAPRRRMRSGGGISAGVGCDLFVAPYVAVELQTQIVVTRDLPRIRALVGISVPIGRYAPPPDPAAPPPPSTFSAVKAGHTAWVTMADGRRVKGVVSRVSETTIDVIRARATTSLPVGEIRRIEVPDALTDGAKRGAYIGLLMAIPAVLSRGAAPFFYSVEDPSEYALAFVAWGAIGAGMGAVIGAIADGLIEEHRLVYQAGPSALTIAPIVSRHTAGIGGVIRW